jgi:hypothetical protein
MAQPRFLRTGRGPDRTLTITALALLPVGIGFAILRAR